MARIGWGASLLGDNYDLEGWRLNLKQPHDPWVEVTNRGHLLRCNALSTLTEPLSVRDKATTLISFLNGALSLSHQLRPVRFGGVVELMEDGSEHHHVLLEGHVTVRVQMHAELVVLGPSGKPRLPERSLAQQWLALTETDDHLSDAIQHYSRSLDWFEIYKCYECLTLKYGGEKKFLALDWVDEPQAELLRRTANNERHARLKNKPISHPMSLDVARELLGMFVRRALQEELDKRCSKTQI